jgi:hypothetical protein
MLAGLERSPVRASTITDIHAYYLAELMSKIGFFLHYTSCILPF